MGHGSWSTCSHQRDSSHTKEAARLRGVVPRTGTDHLYLHYFELTAGFLGHSLYVTVEKHLHPRPSVCHLPNFLSVQERQALLSLLHAHGDALTNHSTMTPRRQPNGGSAEKLQAEREGTGTPYPLWSRHLERLPRIWAVRERRNIPKLPDESSHIEMGTRILITSAPL